MHVDSKLAQVVEECSAVRKASSIIFQHEETKNEETSTPGCRPSVRIRVGLFRSAAGHAFAVAQAQTGDEQSPNAESAVDCREEVVGRIQEQGSQTVQGGSDCRRFRARRARHSK